MNPIWIFTDLDDTLFQTKRKRADGVIQATQGTTLSYMTRAQQHYLQWLQQAAEVKIVPTTARDWRQYHNTQLSQDPNIGLAVLYHSGMILEQGQPDPEWHSQQQAQYKNLSQSVHSLWHLLQVGLDTTQFTLFNVDSYYLSIKARHDTPLSQRSLVFEQMKSLVVTTEYIWQQTDRALHIFPHFLNKRWAVEYLIAKHQPTLTIGMGDSQTDLGFMGCCDFQMFPQQSEIARLIQTATGARPGYPTPGLA